MMSLLVTATRFRGLALGVALLTSCGGKVIALGDGSAPAGAGGWGGVGPVVTAGTAGSTATGPGEAGAGGAAPEACPSSGITANEVLWIGDSWVTIPAATAMPSTSVQRARVRDRAREAHAIGIDEDYACSAAAAANMAAVAKQYADRQAVSPVRVIIMDGGTWDPIAAQLAGTSIDEAVATSVDDFEQFLRDVASDGTVEDIVYFMVPSVDAIPRVDELRPQFEEACRLSEVRCHFLNLGDFWQDDYSNGIQASAAGANVIGDQIWDIMVKNCIAQ